MYICTTFTLHIDGYHTALIVATIPSHSPIHVAKQLLSHISIGLLVGVQQDVGISVVKFTIVVLGPMRHLHTRASTSLVCLQYTQIHISAGSVNLAQLSTAFG